MKAHKNTSLAASDTITRIVTNQIVKEKDDINISVVPAGAKPRPRKKPGQVIPPEAPSDLSRTKSDLVHRFLQHTAEQVTLDPVSRHVDLDDDVVDVGGVSPVRPTIDLSVDPYSLLPPLDPSTISWSDEEDDSSCRVTRNPITGEMPDGAPDEEVMTPEVAEVERLEGEWPGVTGTSSSTDFHSWTETFTVENDNTDVYILPYVDL